MAENDSDYGARSGRTCGWQRQHREAYDRPGTGACLGRNPASIEAAHVRWQAMTALTTWPTQMRCVRCTMPLFDCSDPDLSPDLQITVSPCMALTSQAGRHR
jgi:hypothetical protein